MQVEQSRSQGSALTERRAPTVTAVILAAGESRRMGRPKLLLPWTDGTVLDAVLTMVAAASADAALLVTGAYRDRVAAIAAAHGVATVHNPAYAAGEMVSSLQAALPRVVTDAAVILLGDMPVLTAGTLDAVLAAYRAGRGTIVAPMFDGRRGHPVLFDRTHFAALLALPAGGAPRDVVRRHAAGMVTVPVDDPGVLADIDTPEAYARWRPQP